MLPNPLDEDLAFAPIVVEISCYLQCCRSLASVSNVDTDCLKVSYAAASADRLRIAYLQMPQFVRQSGFRRGPLVSVPPSSAKMFFDSKMAVDRETAA
jgi:hypothetical protein